MKELKLILRNATKNQKQSLGRILEAEGTSAGQLAEAFWWNCQSVFGYVLGFEPQYRDVVSQVASKLGIAHGPSECAADLEVKIAQAVMRSVWERMTPEQRAKMEEKLRDMAEE